MSESDYSDSDSESSGGEEGAPAFKLVSSSTFRRLAELAPAASHNSPPTPAELRAANSMEEESSTTLWKCQQTITKIDAQIDALQRQKRTILSEATTQQSVLELCKKIKTPIRRLPLDILREIALQIALMSRSEPLTPALTSSPNCVFAQVCSIWRAVALSTPELWDTLHLYINDIHSLPIYTRRASEWFKRAKTRPLSFLIYLKLDHDNITTYAHSHIRPFLESLSPIMPNTVHLGLQTWTEHLKTLFKVPLDYTFRGLQQLEIIAEYGSAVSVPQDLKLFKSTPSPLSLSIPSISSTNKTLPDIVVWSQLTRLCISQQVKTLDWITVMESCPNLHTGIFSLMSRIFLNSDSLPESIPHSKIENLSLELTEDYPSFQFVELFYLFRMPKLVKLDLVRGSNEFDWTLHPGFIFEENTPGFLQKPCICDVSQLKFLSICHTDYLKHTIILSILSKTINLSELKLKFPSPFPSTLIESLTFDIGRGVSGISCNIVPNLSAMKIDISNEITLEDTDFLLKMLLSRRNEALPTGCRPLSSVLINSVRASVDYLLNIGFGERCKKSGLAFDIHQRPKQDLYQCPEDLYVPRDTPSVGQL